MYVHTCARQHRHWYSSSDGKEFQVSPSCWHQYTTQRASVELDFALSQSVMVRGWFSWMVLIWLRPATGMTPHTAISGVLFGAFPQLETQQEAERLESSGRASLKFVTNHLEARDGWLIYSAKHIILFLIP